METSNKLDSELQEGITPVQLSLKSTCRGREHPATLQKGPVLEWRYSSNISWRYYLRKIHSEERKDVNPFSKYRCRWKSKKRGDEGGKALSRCLRENRVSEGQPRAILCCFTVLPRTKLNLNAQPPEDTVLGTLCSRFHQALSPAGVDDIIDKSSSIMSGVSGTKDGSSGI